MKPRDFAKSFKINKALGKAGIMFSKGDSLLMNSCKYLVKSPTGAKQTILEDERGMRIAIPSNKIALLVKSGLARRQMNPYGFFKAQMPGVPGMATKPQGVPVGTMKQDSSGGWRKKISANPSVWVHMQNGTSHPDHDTDDAHHPLLHDESRRHAQKVHLKVLRHAHESDHDNLKKKFDEYVHELSTFKNLTAAHNTPEVDEKSGKKLPRAGMATSTQQHVFSKQDKANTMLKDFVKDFKSSISKKKKEKTNG